MIQHKLNLNDDKTETLAVGSRSRTSLIDSQLTEIGKNNDNNYNVFFSVPFLLRSTKPIT